MQNGAAMRIGYACLTVGVSGAGQKSCTRKYADEARLRELIAHNLDALAVILEYNRRNGIRLFRISSDLIPFGSSEVNSLPWTELFAERFGSLGETIRKNGMRVSMHPGQYTVLNSTNESVVQRAIEDLAYHTRVLDALETGPEHKIVLHIGGEYGNKTASAARFAENCEKLSDPIRQRLVIENDDRSYTVRDVLALSKMTGFPVVYDTLHNAVNPADPEKDDRFWIEACRSTWKLQDGPQKIHYSQQAVGKRPGSHAETIRIEPFLSFMAALSEEPLDIMLEVKDKNLSAVKCSNCLAKGNGISALEQEWSRYKYNVLERSPKNYQAIRSLLKQKNGYPAAAFYSLLEDALSCEAEKGNALNAAQHVWGYFKDRASIAEKSVFLKKSAAFAAGEKPLAAVKRELYSLAVRYREEYLLTSYYFLF